MSAPFTYAAFDSPRDREHTGPEMGRIAATDLVERPHIALNPNGDIPQSAHLVVQLVRVNDRCSGLTIVAFADGADLEDRIR